MKSLLIALLLAVSAVCHADPIVELKDMPQLVQEAKKGGPFVILFTAEWCGPCKIFHPVYERLSKEMNVRFFTVDIDNPAMFQLAARIPGYPMVLVFNVPDPKKPEMTVCPAVDGAAPYEKAKANILKCLAQ